MAPLMTRAAASGSTSAIMPSSLRRATLSVIMATQPLAFGHERGVAEHGRRHRWKTMRWISGSSAIWM